MMVFTVWDICQDHNDPADWYVFKLGLWLDQADNTPASPAAAARTSRELWGTLRTLPGNSVERNTSKCKSCILYDDVAIQSLFPLHCWSLQMMNNNNSRPRVWQQLPVQCLDIGECGHIGDGMPVQISTITTNLAGPGPATIGFHNSLIYRINTHLTWNAKVISVILLVVYYLFSSVVPGSDQSLE